MRTALLGMALAVVAGPAAAQSEETYYFRLDWCPTKVEREQLGLVLRTVYVGCCLYKATAIPGADPRPLLERYSDKRIPAGDLFGRCSGEDLDERERLRLEAERAAANEVAEAREAPARAARQRADLPAKLRAMRDGAFCAAYGHAFRGDRSIAPLLTTADIKVVLRAEARARALVIAEDMTIARSMKIGATTCEMHASMGLPERANRTVSAAGESVQHVYGSRVMVYTTNGRVTAWQD